MKNIPVGEQLSVAVVAGDGKKLYLIMTKDGGVHVILGWKEEQDAINYFTNGYNANHDRGYEPSMSACLHYILFSPRILTFKSMPELIEVLLGDPNDLSLFELGSIAGGFVGLECKSPKARAAYEAGISPQLITPKLTPDE